MIPRSKGEPCTGLPLLLALLIAAEAAVGTTRLAAQSVDGPYRGRLSLTSGSNLALTAPVAASQPLGDGGTLLASDAMTGGSQPGTFQPSQVDAIFSWTGATSTTWSTATNWNPSVGAPPGPNDTASFDGTFTNQPIVTASTTVGSLLMTDPVAQNVTLSDSGNFVFTINGVGGTGILINNTNAFTFTIASGFAVALGGDQAWTNNSGNLFTDNGTTNLNAHALTVNGTGNTTISGVISGTTAASTLTKDGSGTLTLTAANTYVGTTTVNGGTLLVNGNGDLGTGAVTVNNSGTVLGGTASNLNNPSSITVNAGAVLTPANVGTAGSLSIGSPLTISAGANFHVDLLGTSQGTTYDFLTGLSSSTFNFAGSNLTLHVGFATTTGQTFTIVHSGGGFRGQQFAQGTSVTGDDGKIYSITYSGDSIILQWTGAFIPEPSTWLGGAFAVAALAFTQRRRLRKLLAFSR